MRRWIFVFVILTLVAACKREEEKQSASTAHSAVDPAIEKITAKIEKNPGDVSLYVARAQVFHRLGAYDEAIFDLNHAIKMDTTRYENFMYLSDVLLDYNRSKDALRVINNAVSRFPENVQVRLKQAKLYYLLKQYHQSLAALDKVLELDDQNPEAFFLFGQNFKELGDSLRAIKSYQEAVDIDADIIDGWINLGNLWSGKGPAIAEKYFKTALTIDSTNIYALNAYALFLGAHDRFDESIKVYDKLARVDPQFSDGFFNAGIMYLEMDSVKQANRRFDLAVKTNPTFAKAYYYRGLTYEKMGKKDLAQADYENALKFDADMERAQKALDKLKRL